MADIEPFVVTPFKGVLCLFLLDMGLVASRGIRQGARDLSVPLGIFAIVMPLVGGVLGAVTASASYIAVPAAIRLPLLEARPSIYLSLSLGITFLFNLTLGIPVYLILGNMAGG